MAFFSPTIAAKRASRSAEANFVGVSAMFIACCLVLWFARANYSAPGRTFPTSGARCGRARQPVVDRLAESLARHRHDRDGRGTGRVERAQMGEQVGGGLDQVAAP